MSHWIFPCITTMSWFFFKKKKKFSLFPCPLPLFLKAVIAFLAPFQIRGWGWGLAHSIN